MLLNKINKLLIDLSVQEKISTNVYNFVINNLIWEKFFSHYINFIKACYKPSHLFISFFKPSNNSIL